jgi:tetratricopeptide (TPR) repeat protein
MGRWRRAVSYIALLLVLGGPLSAGARQAPAAPAGVEDLDQKAKRLFVAGQYAEAIEILARLYTETDNPIYLRNIGRCHQRLRDPDRAIASFEEYLQKARNISKAERDEVRGFVRELEEMKKRNAEASRSGAETRPAPPGPAPPSPTIPSPAIMPPASPPASSSPAPSPAPTDLVPGPLAVAPTDPQVAPFAPTASPTGPADLGASAGRPLARTVAVAAMALAGALVVGGGVALVTSWTKFKSAEKNCRGNYWCAETAAKSVEGRNRTAKILLGGGLVVGAAGVAVFLLNPAPAAGGLALGLRGRF